MRHRTKQVYALRGNGRNGTFVRKKPASAYQVFLRFLNALLAVVLIVLLAWIPVQQVVNNHQENVKAHNVADEVGRWSPQYLDSQRSKATKYNEDIASVPQNELGESDPFDLADRDPQAPTGSALDKRYMSLLNEGDGAMGNIVIPKISVDLPIFHGTSSQTLLSGAGHLFGTSLPVGGPSTNAVIAGHRGVPKAMFFTRLDEIKNGDWIYINTLDQVKSYRVIDINIVLPDDTHLYKVVPGQDLVTLMTCTPFGSNTHRLIVTAMRDERGVAPTQKDALLWAVVAAAAVFVIGMAYVVVRNHMKRAMFPVPAHAARKR